MKNPAGLIVTILVIVAPIVWCCVNLINVNNDYDKNNDFSDITDNINDVIDENIANNTTSGEDKTSGDDTYTSTMGGDTVESSIGAPIGKIVEGAMVNVSVANVYTNPDETSTLAGTVNKNTVITSQDYPNNWSRVKLDNLSGWMKTEYITKPDDIGSTSIGTVIGKTGVVNVDSLNVREEPVNGKIITTLTMDTDVKILAVNDAETWYQVQWRTTLGWVSADYITVKY